MFRTLAIVTALALATFATFRALDSSAPASRALSAIHAHNAALTIAEAR